MSNPTNGDIGLSVLYIASPLIVTTAAYCINNWIAYGCALAYLAAFYWHLNRK